jgi:hypothetical protein
MVRVVRTWRPGRGRARYDTLYGLYRELTQALAPLFGR